MNQQRAKVGGEYGANGEWYEGGKFIATTDHAKCKAAKRRNGPRRALIEPGVWAELPEGKLPIFPMISPLATFESNGKARMFNASHPCWRMYDYNAIEAAVLAYNNGERFRDIPA